MLQQHSNDGQDTKKQREALSLKLSSETATYGDIFKGSYFLFNLFILSEDCILILQRFMANTEKKMEELCIATKNTKESQIKSELPLLSINQTINLIS